MSIEITQKYGKGVTYKGEDGNLYFKDEAGNVTSFTDPDQLVKISSDDTTASYLESKLVAGSNVTLTTNNSGGNETITIAAAADNDEKAKVSANDTTSGYLDGKLVAGSGITLTQNNDGGNETLTITANVADTNDKARVSANDTTPGYLNGKLVAGANVTFTEGNDGGDETLTIAAAGGVTGFTGSQNTASPNNTVNASQLLVDATSTNADFVIQPKGTGGLLVNLPDNATAGGNKRALGVIDLQSARGSSGYVAYGVGSVILGGYNNLTGTGSGRSGILAGSWGQANGVESGVVAGSNAQANGNYSVVLGGQQNRTYGMYSVSFGYKGIANGMNSLAQGAASFGMFSAGEAQREEHVQQRKTTDSTPTELTSDGQAPNTTNRIVLRNRGSYIFSALIVGRVEGSTETRTAGYKVEGMAVNNSNVVSLLGTPVVTVIAEDTAGWSVDVEANVANSSLSFKVTGEGGTTIRWTAAIRMVVAVGFS